MLATVMVSLLTPGAVDGVAHGSDPAAARLCVPPLVVPPLVLVAVDAAAVWPVPPAPASAAAPELSAAFAVSVPAAVAVPAATPRPWARNTPARCASVHRTPQPASVAVIASAAPAASPRRPHPRVMGGAGV